MRFSEEGNIDVNSEICIENNSESFNESDGPWMSDSEYQDDAVYDRKIAELNTNRMRDQYMNVRVFHPDSSISSS